MAENLSPSDFILRSEAELLIERALQPIHQNLSELSASYKLNTVQLDNMEEKQDDRWEDQEVWKSKVMDDLIKIKNSLSIRLAVTNDRKWLFTTLIAIGFEIWRVIHGR